MIVDLNICTTLSKWIFMKLDAVECNQEFIRQPFVSIWRCKDDDDDDDGSEKKYHQLDKNFNTCTDWFDSLSKDFYSQFDSLLLLLFQDQKQKTTE